MCLSRVLFVCHACLPTILLCRYGMQARDEQLAKMEAAAAADDDEKLARAWGVCAYIEAAGLGCCPELCMIVGRNRAAKHKTCHGLHNETKGMCPCRIVDTTVFGIQLTAAQQYLSNHVTVCQRFRQSTSLHTK